MAIFYAVVEGDPISGGGNSRVIEGWPGSTIQGEDGRVRMQTFLGQRAYCDVCKSTGVIVAVPGSPDTRRMYDAELRAHEALGGDLVFCKCERHPRVISMHGTSVMIEDGGGAQHATPARILAEQAAPFDEQVRAIGEGASEGYPYFIETADGQTFSGRVDASGRLPRISTAVADTYAVYWGDEALAQEATP